MAAPARPPRARRPLITAWRRPRTLEMPGAFLRSCVLARRRQRPPGHGTYLRERPLAKLLDERDARLVVGPLHLRELVVARHAADERQRLDVGEQADRAVRPREAARAA